MSKPITLSIENAPDSFFAKVKELRGNNYLDYYKNRFQTVQDNNPRRWSIVAITVGALIILGVGGFGGIGLLHSYGVIGTFPPQLQWLSSAIGTIGNTPHFWSLWVLTGGGIAVGAVTLVLGARALKKEILSNMKQCGEYNYLLKRANRAGEETLRDMKEFGEYRKLFAAEFGSPKDKKMDETSVPSIDKEHYALVRRHEPTDGSNDHLGDKRYYVAFRDGQSKLFTTGCMTEDRQIKVGRYLKAIGLQEQPKKK
jgi:hypothetical protein